MGHKWIQISFPQRKNQCYQRVISIEIISSSSFDFSLNATKAESQSEKSSKTSEPRGRSRATPWTNQRSRVYKLLPTGLYNNWPIYLSLLPAKFQTRKISSISSKFSRRLQELVCFQVNYSRYFKLGHIQPYFAIRKIFRTRPIKDRICVTFVENHMGVFQFWRSIEQRCIIKWICRVIPVRTVAKCLSEKTTINAIR